MPVFPANADWGNPSISTFARHVEADWVICLCDAWVMKPDAWDENLRMAIWAPVDEYPPPPAVMTVLKHERVRPIAMSRFGENWLQKAGLGPLYVPHGVDTSVFKWQPEHKAIARRALNVPEDAFLVGMVAANRGWSQHAPRKSFPQVFDAFSQFAREHDDAYLYVHSQAQPPPPGLDLIVMARAYGIPENRLAFPPDEAWHLTLMDNKFLAGIYNALDVLANPSMAEGFGIPIIEAQACGAPVIVSNHSSMPELCGEGWLVDGDKWWDGAQLGFGIIPRVSFIVDALEAAYAARADHDMRARAVQFAATYDADRVTDLYWDPVIKQLDKPREVGPLPMLHPKDVADRTMSRQVRRAQARKKAKQK